MQTIEASELERGQAVMLDGVPHIVEDLYVVGSAKTRRKVHTRLRNLQKGLHVERAFTEGERIPIADLEQRSLQFSYRDGDRFVFLDAATYEELALPAERIGDRQGFLKEDESYRGLFLEGELLDIVVPDTIALRVESTALPQRGGSDATWKPAVLEGGIEVMVPLFIAAGDIIRVDTRTRKYVRKESGEA